MKSKKRIVVTGIGPIGSPGIGKKSLWLGLSRNETGLVKGEHRFNDSLIQDFYIHKVKRFKLDDYDLDRNKLKFIKSWKNDEENPDLNLMLVAAKLALEDAKLLHKSDHMGLIVTHENPCLEQFLDKIFSVIIENKKLGSDFHKVYSELVKIAYETQPFMLLFHIAKVFDIKNYSIYLNNACASGLYALEAASDVIKSMKVNKMLIVAGDCPTYYKNLWFRSLNMCADDGKIRPFSKHSTGFVLGEGAVALLLEDYETAMKRKANIYAEYLGGGFFMDNWKVTLPAIHEDGLENSVRNALAGAAQKTDDVDLICSHGVGTQINDKFEIKVFNKIFAESTNVHVTALKPYIGHNLGGSALLETAILLLMMENKVILPIINTEKESALASNLPYVFRKIRKSGIRCALKVCSAFAGFNGAALFRKLT